MVAGRLSATPPLNELIFRISKRGLANWVKRLTGDEGGKEFLNGGRFGSVGREGTGYGGGARTGYKQAEMAFDITSSNRVLKDRRDVLKALKPSEQSIKLKQGIRNFPRWLFLQKKFLHQDKPTAVPGNLTPRNEY